MMRYFKYIFLLITCIVLAGLNSYAQNKKELLHYGDESFKNQNYVAAAYFYGKVVGSYMTGEQDLVYPYEFTAWNAPLKIDEADTSKLDSNAIEETVADLDTLSDDTTKSSNETLEKVKTNENYRYALYQLAESYRLSFNYLKAETTYLQCVDLGITEYPLLQFWYALSMKKNMKYDAAHNLFNEYIKATKTEPYSDSLGTNYYKRAKKERSGCKKAVEWINEPVVGIEVNKMDSNINGGVATFSASYFNEEGSVFFATARSEQNSDKAGQGKIEPCNVYTLSLDEDSIWTNLSKFKGTINSYKNEGGMAISNDETLLYFTRWGETDGIKECHIYLSKKFNGRWLPPQKLKDNVNITGYISMHPYFTSDGTKLFYSSNRPGGKGRMDIWYCEMDELEILGTAINVGWPVNTREDEVSPMYLWEEKALYFSSNGHIGMGGFDIFEVFGELEELYGLENLGFPINSGKDDKFFVLNKNVNKGFLSSDRADCPDCESGNCLELYEVDYGPPKFILSGHVYSKAKKEPISNALITITDVSEYYDPFYVMTDPSGFYTTPLRREMTYTIKAQKVRYFADASDVSTEGLVRSQEFVRDFYLPLIPTGEIEIQGIEYDYDKWDLRPEAKITLDSLVFFLGVNNNITIELSSHTDNRGDDDYNEKLSQKRAQSVVDYLILKGIPLDRLTPVGYGEKKPVIIDAETEEEHQRNRRTAFEVLRQDYVELKHRRRN